MSLCRENRRGKSKKNESIDLSSIITFIKVIQGAAAIMLGISIIGLLLVSDNKSAQTIYTMVIIVNLITAAGGIIPIRYLKNKAQKLA